MTVFVTHKEQSEKAMNGVPGTREALLSAHGGLQLFLASWDWVWGRVDTDWM